MITKQQIAQASPSELAEIHDDLLIARAIKDRWFSEFLDEHELEEDNTDTGEWRTYRQAMVEYGNINDLILTTKYYLGQHGKY